MATQLINAHCPFDYAIFKDVVCTIGVYDGVHIGHRKIIGDTITRAKELEKRSVIITFSIDPDEIYHPDRLEKLMSNETRLKELTKLGANSVAVLPFDAEFGNLEPLQFLAKIFRKFPPSEVHVGVDFGFGNKASGNIEDMRAWGERYNMRVVGHDLLEYEGSPVTSTRIRRLLSVGNTSEANLLLGR